MYLIKKMSIKKVVAVTFFMLLILVSLGVYSDYSGKKFAKTQVNYLRTVEYEELFKNFTKELKNVYSGTADFDSRFGPYGISEVTSEPVLTSVDRNSGNTVYKYNVVREDDNSVGYEVTVTAVGILFSRGVSDIVVQPVRFLEEQ